MTQNADYERVIVSRSDLLAAHTAVLAIVYDERETLLCQQAHRRLADRLEAALRVSPNDSSETP